MFAIIQSLRFDDVDETSDLSYRGWNHVVEGSGTSYKVRIYDDEPKALSVIDPTDAAATANAKSLCDFLVAQFGVETIMFYQGTKGTYVPVNLQTLEFICN